MFHLKRYAVIPFILALAIIMAACSSPATTAPTSAAIKDLSGTVNIKQAGASDYVKATTDMTLQQNGSMQTGADGRVRLDLSTGTIIRMSPSSLFTLTASTETNGSLSTTFNLTVGRIFIILNGGTVDVQTPSGVASVLGSYLSVEIDPTTGDVYVTCLEGHCAANNPAGSVDLTSGEKTTLFHRDPTTGQYTAPGAEPMSPDDYQEWLNENPEAASIINQANATLTALAPVSTQPPATEPPPPATEAVTPPPVGNNNVCVNITNPVSDSTIPKYGPINFTWDANPNASKYIVTFHYPDGSADTTFETADPNLTRYAESMPSGGNYSWDVTVIGSDGNQVCKTDAITFSKLKSSEDKPPKKPNPPVIQPPEY